MLINYKSFERTVKRFGYSLGLCCCSLEADKEHVINCKGLYNGDIWCNHVKPEHNELRINKRRLDLSLTGPSDDTYTLKLTSYNHYFNSCYRGDITFYQARVKTTKELISILKLMETNLNSFEIHHYRQDYQRYERAKEYMNTENYLKMKNKYPNRNAISGYMLEGYEENRR